MEDLPEIHKNSLTILDNGKPKKILIKRAWSKTSLKGIDSKFIKIVGIVGFFFCILSITLSSFLFVQNFGKNNDINTILFGPSRNLDRKYENGILMTMLNNIDKNKKFLESLHNWANGTGCLSGSGFQYK